jgi:opacity protein-like surface antigen
MTSSGPPAAVLLVVLGLALGSPAPAQTPPPAADAREVPREALRVFVDCAGFSCDSDFVRTEIDFVNHVRDRRDAQVLVLITTQPTGERGREFTASFIGQKDFRGIDDSLRYTMGPTESPDRMRQALSEVLKRGLVRYVNHTPLAERIRISYAAPTAQQAARTAAHDPWNYWTFGTTLSGTFNGEQSYNFITIDASLSANRTTEAWKVNTSFQLGYTRNRVTASEVPSITTVSRDYGVDALVAKSVNSHWSLGARATLTSSTFLNQSLALRLAPAVEYNVFPYSQSTRRQFTLQYSMGATAFRYDEETIFGRTSETLLDQKLVASVGITQPWGSVATSAEGSYYLQDLSKWRGVIVSNLDLHLFGGFSLLLLGGLELVHDQVYLPAQGASVEDILLRQRQLATSYHYWSSIGFTYTFGSPFANVVNPRFAGSSGGIPIIR